MAQTRGGPAVEPDGDDEAPVSRKRRREPFIIGKEFAAARDAERKLLEVARGDESPIPARTYDFWRGELNLANPMRLSLDDELAAFVRRSQGRDAKAFETPDSLARFGPGIQSVLKRHTAGKAYIRRRRP